MEVSALEYHSEASMIYIVASQNASGQPDWRPESVEKGEVLFAVCC